MNRFFKQIWRFLKRFFVKPSDVEMMQKKGCEFLGGGGVITNGFTTIQKWHPSGRIIFNEGVVLNNLPDSNLAGILHECRFVTMRANAVITIGQGSGLSGVTIMCAEKVTIGAHVAIGANVTIYDNDMHAVNPFLRTYDNDNHVVAKEVVIEDYAWIGAHSIILKGVRIGRGAVIGASSVVTKDVPSLTVYAGNPARYIKHINLPKEQYESLFGRFGDNKLFMREQ